MLFTTSIGFDLSCYDIFGSLAAGSTIHLAPSSAPDQLFKLITAGKISFWDSAPQVLQQLEPALADWHRAGSKLSNLRLVFLSGDWVPLSLVRTVRQAGAQRVVALGGATEVTVWSNYFEVAYLDDDWQSIPYGRPIWNHQYYCLGNAGPLHVGMTGELYIGGVGVAEGYIGRPDLTSERFLPNSLHSGRMYRTGDMVRFMQLKPWGDTSQIMGCAASDIVLEFLGRRDSQVKVRGYRVELAEIELAFLKQPGVEAASVLALPSSDGGSHLVSFLVAEAGAAEAARQGVGSLLPTYMVPDVSLCLPALPLTNSGKVDRAKLESFWEARPGKSISEAKGSNWEQEVCKAFEEVLGQPVGVDDDFFDLGGHSLMAMRLQTALKAHTFTLPDVFRTRTPKALAKLLADRRAESVPCRVFSQPCFPVNSNNGPARLGKCFYATFPEVPVIPRLQPCGEPKPPASFAQDSCCLLCAIWGWL